VGGECPNRCPGPDDPFAVAPRASYRPTIPYQPVSVHLSNPTQFVERFDPLIESHVCPLSSLSGKHLFPKRSERFRANPHTSYAAWGESAEIPNFASGTPNSVRGRFFSLPLLAKGSREDFGACRVA
jgi:hypothetical protein